MSSRIDLTCEKSQWNTRSFRRSDAVRSQLLIRVPLITVRWVLGRFSYRLHPPTPPQAGRTQIAKKATVMFGGESEARAHLLEGDGDPSLFVKKATIIYFGCIVHLDGHPLVAHVYCMLS